MNFLKIRSFGTNNHPFWFFFCMESHNEGFYKKNALEEWFYDDV